MFRNKYKNKDTGQEVLLWREYNTETEQDELSEDILWTKMVDSSQYEIIETEETEYPTPFELFGVECGKGWYSLIQPITDWIDKYNSELEPDEKEVWPIEFSQIKEKWGVLVIHVSYGTPELFELIHNAEIESATICEFCGTKEHIGITQGYYMTVCHNCCKEMAIRRNFGSYMWHSKDDDKFYWISPDKEDEEVSRKELEEMP